MRSRQLRICEFNVENLFVSMAYHEGRSLESLNEAEWRGLALAQLRRKQKPLWQLWGLSKAILDIDADIVMLVEVGGQDSLESFNEHFLGGRYSAVFIEGNARRGIDLGFLVRKGLPFRTEARTNRDTEVEVFSWQTRYLSRFSRDVAELRLVDESGLRLILLLCHLKSKISSEQDFRGKDVRMGEAIALARFYLKLREGNPGVPVLLGGDFNADLASVEFELLRATDLKDFHELLGTPPEERVSLVYFDHAGRPHPQVLDYLLLSPELHDSVVPALSGTYRYKGFHEVPDPLPASPRERFQMPSDHYPLVVTLDF